LLEQPAKIAQFAAQAEHFHTIPPKYIGHNRLILLMQNLDPKQRYDQQLEQLHILETQLTRRKKTFAWLRFFSIVASFTALWQLWNFGIALAFAGFIILFGLFIFTVVRDLKNKEEIENTRLLLQIARREVDILNHQYFEQQDGKHLPPEHHPYANDLDIFGKASIYQYTNRTTSEQGNRVFADWLLHPAEPALILQRQEAAKELAGNMEWRHQLLAYGIKNPVTVAGEKKIEEWLKSPNKFIDHLFWKITRTVFPAIALTALGLHIFGTLSASVFYPLVILFFALSFLTTKQIMPHYLLLNKIVPELETLKNSIHWIENSPFKSNLLSQLKSNFISGESNVSSTIRGLKKILERFDYRFNPLIHIPLNTFFLWDLQQMIALEKWKAANKQNSATWFYALAQVESLASIGTLSFNHPDWCFPLISTEPGVFIAEDLGHPLIPKEKRVTNSFSTEGFKQLNLITGSNMAGKSTFLRSVGVNIVFAMMGAPACSGRLRVAHVAVISSMRVSDNLEENTSTFYAELKKLKEIIDAVNNKENVFLLLDEILRGTNSADRQAGSIALIKQLIQQNAIGLIATHDLELTKLSVEFPNQLHNYHFDVQVQDEELYFDYKIKTGICTSMNASLLMKKIGIKL
jgi:hypothetical protein